MGTFINRTYGGSACSEMATRTETRKTIQFKTEPSGV